MCERKRYFLLERTLKAMATGLDRWLTRACALLRTLFLFRGLGMSLRP